MSNFGQQALNVVVVMVLTRLLAPDAFGLVALAMAVMAILEVFRESGFNDSLIQKADLRQEHLDTIYTVSLGIGVAITVVVAATSGLIAAAFGEPALADVIWALAALPTLASLNATKNAMLRKEMRFELITLVAFVSTASTAALAVVLALMNYGVWSLVAKALAGPVVAFLCYRFIRVSSAHIGFSRQAFRELSTVSFYVLGTNLLNIVSRRADDLIVGGFLGTTALGYYSIAYNLLLSLTRILIRTINGVTLPVFSKLQADPIKLGNAFRRIVTTTTIVTIPTFAWCSLNAHDVIRVLYGPDWSPSGDVFRILALVGMLHSVTFFQSSVLLGAGKVRWRLALNTGTSLMNAAGFLIGVQFGLVGVACGALVATAIALPIGMSLVLRVISLDRRETIESLMRTAAAVMLMVGAVQLYRSFTLGSLDPGLQLLTNGLLAALAYGLFTIVLAPKNLQELRGTVAAVMPNKGA